LYTQLASIEKKRRVRYEHAVHETTEPQQAKSMSVTPPPSGEEHAPPAEEAPMGAAQYVHIEFSPAHLIRVVIVNILVLAELCAAMYMANQNPEEFTPTFFKVFFSLLAPTLILAAISKRFVRPKRKE
jgi:hypothetical protein